MATNLAEVMTADLCSGCGACAAIAPDAMSIEMTDAGVLRPKAVHPLTQTQSRMIERVCPGMGQTVPAAKSDPVWGPVKQLRKGHAADVALRHAGASGGALSGFVLSLLDSGVVDAVLHTAADPDDPLQNVTTLSRTRADLLFCAGSRYAPSSPLDRVGELLDSNQTYAFVGRPCDVSALAAWRQHDTRVAQRFPVLVSFLCAGTPSRRGGESVLRSMGVAPGLLAKFDYRGPGWPGQATAKMRDKEVRHMSYSESWGAILSRHVQHRCKLCADGSGVFADVVFGDIWEADKNGYPSFDDRPGQSAILVRTETGAEMLKVAEEAGVLRTQPLKIAALTAMQPGQVRRRRVLLARLAGVWAMGRPVPRFRGLGLARMARDAGPVELLRNALGSMRRARAIPRKGGRTC